VRWNIRLLLNPREADHAGLVGAIDAFLAHLQEPAADEARLADMVNAVADAAQRVIRDGWRRVNLGT
jgi:hypothetical protein